MTRPATPSLVAAPVEGLGEVLVRTLEDRWVVLGRAFAAARKKPGGRRVHDLRVALRRLDSVVSLVEVLVGGKAERTLRKHVKRLLRRLGDVRDAYVQRKAVASLAQRHRDLAGLRARLVAREKKLEAKVGGWLSGIDMASLQKTFELVAGEALLALSSALLVARHRATLLEAVDRRFSRLIDRRRALDVSDLDTVHSLRVAFKRFRYLVEVLQPVLVGVGKAQLDSMKAFQLMMGEVHDLDLLNRRLTKWRRRKARHSADLVSAHDEIGRRLLQKTDALMASVDDIHTFWNPSVLPSES